MPILPTPFLNNSDGKLSNYFDYSMKVLSHYQSSQEQLTALALHPKLRPHNRAPSTAQIIFYTLMHLPESHPQFIPQNAFNQLINLLLSNLNDFDNETILRIMVKIGEVANNDLIFNEDLINNLLEKVVSTPLSYGNISDIFLTISKLLKAGVIFPLNGSYINLLLKNPEGGGYRPDDFIKILEGLEVIYKILGHSPDKQVIDRLIKFLIQFGPDSKSKAEKFNVIFSGIYDKKPVRKTPKVHSFPIQSEELNQLISCLIKFIHTPTVYKRTLSDLLVKLFPSDNGFIQKKLYPTNFFHPKNDNTCSNLSLEKILTTALTASFYPPSISPKKKSNRFVLMGNTFQELGGIFAQESRQFFAEADYCAIPSLNKVVQKFFRLQMQFALSLSESDRINIRSQVITNLEQLEFHIPTLEIAIGMAIRIYKESPIEQTNSEVLNTDKQNYLFLALINEFITVYSSLQTGNQEQLALSYLTISWLAKHINPYFAEYYELFSGYAVDLLSRMSPKTTQGQQTLSNFSRAGKSFLFGEANNPLALCFYACKLIVDLPDLFSKKLLEIIIKAYLSKPEEALLYLNRQLELMEKGFKDYYFLQIIKLFIHGKEDQQNKNLMETTKTFVLISNCLETMGSFFLVEAKVFLKIAIEIASTTRTNLILPTAHERNLMQLTSRIASTPYEPVVAIITDISNFGTLLFSDKAIKVITRACSTNLEKAQKNMDKLIEKQWQHPDFYLVKFIQAALSAALYSSTNIKETSCSYILMADAIGNLGPKFQRLQQHFLEIGIQYYSVYLQPQPEEAISKFIHALIEYIRKEKNQLSNLKRLTQSMLILGCYFPSMDTPIKQAILICENIDSTHFSSSKPNSVFVALLKKTMSCRVLFSAGNFKCLGDNLIIIGEFLSFLGNSFAQHAPQFYHFAAQSYNKHQQARTNNLGQLEQKQFALSSLIKAKLDFIFAPCLLSAKKLSIELDKLDSSVCIALQKRVIKEIYRSDFNEGIQKIDSILLQYSDQRLLIITRHIIEAAYHHHNKQPLKVNFQLMQLRLYLERQDESFAREANQCLQYQQRALNYYLENSIEELGLPSGLETKTDTATPSFSRL